MAWGSEDGAADIDNSDGLLEREQALEQLATDIAEARDGRGRVTVISGPAGVGKTTVARCVERQASTMGMRVVRARGAHLERRFAFGVMRQLFERVLLSAGPDEQSRLLRGPARPAGALLGAPDPPDLSDENRSFVFLHGLYAFLVNLAERDPVLVLVDDAHWADSASLGWLSYVAGRLHDVAALVVLVTRDAHLSDSGPSWATIAAEPGTRSIAIPALSQAASSVLVQRQFGQSAAPQFSAACYTATGGNPFFLEELFRALRDARVTPNAEGASRVAEQGPATLARSVLLRTARLSSDAAGLARALAVLGSDVELHDAAALAGLEDGDATDAARRLAEEQVIVGERHLSFAHPIVQSSIYADIPGPSRADAHGRAARLLVGTGAPAERLAAHLLIAYSAGDPWTVQVLERAAGDAVERGAPDSAATYLRRALAEPPPEERRQEILARLGWFEYLAHERRSAAEHLIEALHLARTPSDRAELALRTGRVLVIAEVDRSAEAVEILDGAITEVSECDSEIRMRLEAQLIAAASLKLSTQARHRDWIARLRGRVLGESHVERLLLANLVSSTVREGDPDRFPELAERIATGGTPAQLVRKLSEYVLADGQLLREEGPESELFYMAASPLYIADWLDRSAYWFDRACEVARHQGSVVGFALASAFRAEVAYRAGDLACAEAHARAAMPFAPGDVTAVLVNVLLERGELVEAAAMIDRYPIDANGDHLMLQPVIAARGRLRIAQRRLREGADDLLAVGRWFDRWPIKNPGVVSWRSDLAAALASLGERERAEELADGEVELARGLAQPRALGLALRQAALLKKPADGIELLRESVDVLEGSQARLEYARSLTDLGAALRRAGSRTDAREPLRQAVAIGHQCEAVTLTARARTELLATGARPRRVALTGREALTAAERRVAEMAAEGQSTPDIAVALFVSPKTVETHLGHAYQKLDIHSRNQLAQALAAATTSLTGHPQ